MMYVTEIYHRPRHGHYRDAHFALALRAPMVTLRHEAGLAAGSQDIQLSKSRRPRCPPQEEEALAHARYQLPGHAR